MSLIEVISHLPYQNKALLYFKFIYKEEDSDIKSLLNIEKPKDSLNFVELILADKLGLETQIIDRNDLVEAIKQVYDQEMHIDQRLDIINHTFSNNHNKKLEKLKIKQVNKKRVNTLAKRVAVILLILSVGFGSILRINPVACEKFEGWIINTFLEFSKISYISDGTRNTSKYIQLELNYLPEEYEIFELEEGLNHSSYYYDGPGSEFLLIQVLSHEAEISFDIEGVSITEITIKDEYDALYWE